MRPNDHAQAPAGASTGGAELRAHSTAASAIEVLRLCKAAGCLELAVELVEAGATAAQAVDRVASWRQVRRVSDPQAAEIRGMCAAVRLPELAAGYIAAHMPLSAVRHALITVTARRDDIEIDGTLPPNVEGHASSWKHAHAAAKRKA